MRCSKVFSKKDDKLIVLKPLKEEGEALGIEITLESRHLLSFCTVCSQIVAVVMYQASSFTTHY